MMNDLHIKIIYQPTYCKNTLFLCSADRFNVVIFIAARILSSSTELNVIPFASGFSAIFIGIYIIMFRKKLIVHVAGFLILENGIFLFGHSGRFGITDDD